LARKKRGSPRRRRPPSRGLIIGIVVLLTGAAVLIARARFPMTVRPPAAAPAAEESLRPISVDSDWDRTKLRLESEILRIVKPGDHAALYRLTSRTLRGALEEVGVGRAMIDERPGAAAGSGRAPVQWRIQVPRRASLYRINDALTQAIGLLGGRVIRGVERPAPVAGILLDLRLGFGDRVTHAISVEPSETFADQGAQIALIVTDLDRDSTTLYRSVLKSPLVFSVALRSDKSDAGRMGRELRRANREVVLHLPMEPKGYPRVDPGKDAILLDLSRIEIEDRIARCLNAVGPVQGVMSRLGGAALNDPDVMKAVLEDLKRRDLPFFDAHGAGSSVADEVGEETGARTIAVAGTLDGNWPNAAAVRARLKEIVLAAQQRGAIVVTMRPSALVLTVLEAEAAKLKEQGVELVTISRLAL
jgi:hypothetical protein